MKDGKTANVADNILDRNFSPDKPNQRWISDITYVRAYEIFYMLPLLLIYFLIELPIGQSMDKNIDRHLVINALLMAAWDRQPSQRV